MAGKTLNDRKLAGDVRTLGLKKIKAILEDENYPDQDFYKQILLKIVPTLLPRLNEHTGEDGQELPVPILYVPTNHSDKKNNGDEEKDKGDSGGDVSQQDGVGTPLLDSLSANG